MAGRFPQKAFSAHTHESTRFTKGEKYLAVGPCTRQVGGDREEEEAEGTGPMIRYAEQVVGSMRDLMRAH